VKAKNEARKAKVAGAPKVTINNHSGFRLEVQDAVACARSIQHWQHHSPRILRLFADSLERQAAVARCWAAEREAALSRPSQN